MMNSPIENSRARFQTLGGSAATCLATRPGRTLTHWGLSWTRHRSSSTSFYMVNVVVGGSISAHSIHRACTTMLYMLKPSQYYYEEITITPITEQNCKNMHSRHINLPLAPESASMVETGCSVRSIGYTHEGRKQPPKFNHEKHNDKWQGSMHGGWLSNWQRGKKHMYLCFFPDTWRFFMSQLPSSPVSPCNNNRGLGLRISKLI